MVLRLELPMGGYDIYLERGALNRAGKLFSLDRRVLIVTDEGVPAEYAETVARGARASGMSAITIFAIPRDESPTTVAELILKNAPSNAVLLFKASRRVALERVIKEIKET